MLNCGNCIYVFKRANKEYTEHYCRINPPQMCLEEFSTSDARWPEVLPDDWCGSHCYDEK